MGRGFCQCMVKFGHSEGLVEKLESRGPGRGGFLSMERGLSCSLFRVPVGARGGGGNVEAAQE